MTNKGQDWWDSRIKKMGSEEAVRAHMREIRSKSGPSGFSKMDKEKVKKISQKGVEAREKNKD